MEMIEKINVGKKANDGTGDSIRVGAIKTNDNFENINGRLNDVEAEHAIKSKTLIYVDNTRTNNYSEDGSEKFPYRSIKDALTSIIDDNQDILYTILIEGNVYIEHILFDNPHFKFIELKAKTGQVILDPYELPSVIGTTHMDNLNLLKFDGFVFKHNVELINDIFRSEFGRKIIFENCRFEDSLKIKHAKNIELKNCKSYSSDFEFINNENVLLKDVMSYATRYNVKYTETFLPVEGFDGSCTFFVRNSNLMTNNVVYDNKSPNYILAKYSDSEIGLTSNTGKFELPENITLHLENSIVYGDLVNNETLILSNSRVAGEIIGEVENRFIDHQKASQEYYKNASIKTDDVKSALDFLYEKKINIIYVDELRSDDYIPNGSQLLPYKKDEEKSGLQHALENTDDYDSSSDGDFTIIYKGFNDTIDITKHAIIEGIDHNSSFYKLTIDFNCEISNCYISDLIINKSCIIKNCKIANCLVLDKIIGNITFENCEIDNLINKSKVILNNCQGKVANCLDGSTTFNYSKFEKIDGAADTINTDSFSGSYAKSIILNDEGLTTHARFIDFYSSNITSKNVNEAIDEVQSNLLKHMYIDRNDVIYYYNKKPVYRYIEILGNTSLNTSTTIFPLHLVGNIDKVVNLQIYYKINDGFIILSQNSNISYSLKKNQLVINHPVSDHNRYEIQISLEYMI